MPGCWVALTTLSRWDASNPDLMKRWASVTFTGPRLEKPSVMAPVSRMPVKARGSLSNRYSWTGPEMRVGVFFWSREPMGRRSPVK